MSRIKTDKPKILIIDDAPDIIDLLGELLSPYYSIKAATHGQVALKILDKDQSIDLVLMDYMMPDLNGIDILKHMKTLGILERIPVLMLTGSSDDSIETLALEMGAVDFVRKPISPKVLMARVSNQLELFNAREILKSHNDFLEGEVQRHLDENMHLQDVTILSLASLAEMRDNETGQHILRTKNYVKELAILIRNNPKFSPYIRDEYIEMLYKSAPLHDIGKVGIPDNILLKPGKLTDEEFHIMKRHALFGHNAIHRVEEMLGCEEPFLAVAKSIALSHHERWDGLGYPYGIAGDEIPLSARLMAIADVYDALISRRCYKDPIPHAQTVEIIADMAGKNFDPIITQAFIDNNKIFDDIATVYADPEE